MKKYIWLPIILGIIGIVSYFYYINFKKTENIGDKNPPYNAERAALNSITDSNNTDLDNSNSETSNSAINNISQSNKNFNNSLNESNPSPSAPTIETEIASFTTKIYTKDDERQNNLSIACSTLNDTTIENEKTFSFTDTLGKATSKKGYQEADVFEDGEVVQALGGGICQVSTTLYNAVSKVPDIEVTERHEHSNNVPYIESGKDAAVAYGSYDLKFVNNTGSTIKIKAENTTDNITVKILKIEH